MLWLSYLVTIALYAVAFGSYATALLPGSPAPVVRHLFVSLAIVLPAAANVLSAACGQPHRDRHRGGQARAARRDHRLRRLRRLSREPGAVALGEPAVAGRVRHGDLRRLRGLRADRQRRRGRARPSAHPAEGVRAGRRHRDRALRRDRRDHGRCGPGVEDRGHEGLRARRGSRAVAGAHRLRARRGGGGPGDALGDQRDDLRQREARVHPRRRGRAAAVPGDRAPGDPAARVR